MDVKERRQGPDWLTRGLQGLVILCWAGFIVAVFLLERRRSRRREDSLHVNLTILLLIFIASLLFYYAG